MAPNVPSGAAWLDSDENKSQEELALLLPELFDPHLPQLLQDPDSPNLHRHQALPVPHQPHRHPLPRSQHPPLLQTPSSAAPASGDDRRVVGGGGAGPPGNTGPGTRPPQAVRPQVVLAGPQAPGGQAAPVPPAPVPPGARDHTMVSGAPVAGTNGAPRDTPRVAPHHPKDLHSALPPTMPPTTSTSRTTTSSTTSSTTSTSTYSSGAFPSAPRHPVNHGVLKLPGHEPEAPADLNLIHHERTIDLANQTGEGGITVRGDSGSLTPEGATALILVGTCSIFLLLICFIVFVKKLRRQRLERKVAQENIDVKPPVSYDSTGSAPHPLSLLPPALLQALAHPGTLAKADLHHDDQPAFLTMEPPQTSTSIGRLSFALTYDYTLKALLLNVLHARYSKGRSSSTNPGEVWVEACVLTAMNTIKASHVTQHRRAGMAPVFNQKFVFKVGDEEVTQLLLRMTLYDRIPLTEEKAVGSVIVPLSTVDLCSTATLTRDLQ